MRRNKQQWLELLDEQQNSGFSIPDFCEQNSINPKYFYARRSLLKPDREPASGFVRANIAPVHSDAHPCIVIQYGRASVKLPADVSVVRLAELMRALA